MIALDFNAFGGNACASARHGRMLEKVDACTQSL